jgi:uncharacterized protein DUF1801
VAKAENKTKPEKTSVATFINAVENETRKSDAKVILAMMKKVTGEKPVMWGPSIIGFGRRRYKYDSGLDVGFSPRKASMVLYVMGSIPEDDPLRKKLGKYKTGRSCLYINKLEDVDEKVLIKIIEKSYKATKQKWGA